MYTQTLITWEAGYRLSLSDHDEMHCNCSGLVFILDYRETEEELDAVVKKHIARTVKCEEKDIARFTYDVVPTI